MLSELIDNYQKQKKALKSAIASDDIDAVYAIDAEFRKSGELLLQYEPADQSERLVLAKYLIEFVSQADQMGDAKQATMEKLLSLISED